MKQLIATLGRVVPLALLLVAALVGPLVVSGTATAATGKPNVGHFERVTATSNIIPTPGIRINAEGWRGREEAVLMVFPEQGGILTNIDITVNGQKVNGVDEASHFYGRIPAWNGKVGQEPTVTASINGISIVQSVLFKMVWVRDLPGGVVDATTLLPLLNTQNIMVSGTALGTVTTGNPQP